MSVDINQANRLPGSKFFEEIVTIMSPPRCVSATSAGSIPCKTSLSS